MRTRSHAHDAAARKVAKEHFELSKHIHVGSSISEIETTLLNHLPKHRVEMIKGGLNIPNYQVKEIWSYLGSRYEGGQGINALFYD